jgi:hypothetical protein
MKKTLSTLTLFAALAGMSFAASVTVRGHVNDAKCGTKVNAACARNCIKAGSAPVVVTDNGSKVYKIANPDKLKDFAGDHVAVKGSLSGDTLTVTSVEVLK